MSEQDPHRSGEIHQPWCALAAKGFFGDKGCRGTPRGISVWPLRKHIAYGNVKVTRIGRRVFLSPEELERIRRYGLPSLAPSPRRDVVAET